MSCVSLASCSNAIGVKIVSAKLYYSDNKFYADGVEFTLKYNSNVAEAGIGGNKAAINGNFVKCKTGSDVHCFDKYKHLEIPTIATMIDGSHYESTIELDGYYNYYGGDSYNYLTKIKNVKIVNWLK